MQGSAAAVVGVGCQCGQSCDTRAIPGDTYCEEHVPIYIFIETERLHAPHSRSSWYATVPVLSVCLQFQFQFVFIVAQFRLGGLQKSVY